MGKFDDQRESHLNRCHTDRGSLEYFRDVHGCKTMLDVGCGTALHVTLAMQLGYGALGIDLGQPEFCHLGSFQQWDLEDRPWIGRKRADLVWSVEVGEHIKEEQNFIDCVRFNIGKFAVLTWSNCPGAWHQNPKPFEEFLKLFEANGMKPEPSIHNELLKHSTMKREFLRENGMTFSRMT